MKFRNKDGEVFCNIIAAWVGFMCPGPCGDCNLQRGSTCEKEWIESHPREAARLMGYEVVDDEPPTLDEAIEKYLKIKKEANMDKPRICEVLGVEVGERFELGNTGIILLVNDDGLLHIGLSHGSHKETDMNVNYLVKAINDPDRIIRKPRFTEQEVERAKAIRVIYPTAYRLEEADPLIRVWDKEGKLLSHVDTALFPSHQSGQSYTLDEIIGGAE